MRLGKLPARPHAVAFKQADVLHTAALPPRPKTFGHQGLIKTWGMLGNDVVGDCVIAGGCHETMLTNKCAGRTVSFSKAVALRNYSDITGYDPAQADDQGNNPTDNGTDMQAAASYRRKTGLIDSKKARHQIRAYLEPKKADVQQILDAIFYLGGAGIGFEFPDYAMHQFNAHEPWDVIPHQPAPQGGHYVDGVGFDGTYILVVTWGRLQKMTPAFFAKYTDEAISYVYPELIGSNGLTPEGFNQAQLDALLSQVGGVA